METPVTYPTIELGGVICEVKFTRATLYKLDKAGIKFNPQFKPNSATCGFAAIVDTLALCIDFGGSNEDLAELVYDKRDEALTALVNGWGKVVLPSLQAKVAATVAKTKAASETPPQVQ